MEIRNYRRIYFVSVITESILDLKWNHVNLFYVLQQFLLIFLLLGGTLYMLSIDSVDSIKDDTPAFVLPVKYNVGNFLRRKVGNNEISWFFSKSKIQLSSSPGHQDSLPPTGSTLQWDIIQTAYSDQVSACKKGLLSHLNKHSSLFRSNGSLSKFLPASDPADRYVINVNDIGPQVKVEEFFTMVGVSCYQGRQSVTKILWR